MKQDEIDFLRLLRARCSFIDRDGVKHKESPREIINIVRSLLFISPPF